MSEEKKNEKKKISTVVMDWMSHEHEKAVMVSEVIVEEIEVHNYQFVMDGHGHMN